MKNELKLTLFTLTLCFLTACGGGGGGGSDTNSGDDMSNNSSDDSANDSSDDSNDDSANDSNNDSSNDSNNDSGNSADAVAGVAPNPAFSSSASITTPASPGSPSVTISNASGFEGDIIARSVDLDIGAGQTFPSIEFELANGIASLNITDVRRVNAVEATCSNSEDGGTGVLNTNYVTGVQQITGTTQDGQSVSCSYTYNSVLPTTISSSETISNLLTEYADFENEVSSTCPDDEVITDVTEDEVVSCDGKALYNYVITDDTGKTHKVSFQFETMD